MTTYKKFNSSSENEEEFTVEDILGRKIKHGITYYKIKWEGYPISKCTWEPSEHLSESLIKRYEKSISKGTLFSETRSGTSDSDSESDPDFDDKKNHSGKLFGPKIQKILEKIENKNDQVKYKVLYDNAKTKWVLEKDIDDESLLKAFKNKISMNSAKKRQINSSPSGNHNNIPSKKRNIDLSSSPNPPLSTKSHNKKIKVNRSESDGRTSRSSYYTPDEDGIIDIEAPIKKSKLARAFNCNDGSEENGVQFVEKIVCHRIANRKKEYKIRWKGFSRDHDSWQTAETFMDKWIIDEYENGLRKTDGLSEISETSVSESGDSEKEILLVKLMKEVKRGRRRGKDEISGVLGVQYNKFHEKLYVIQLKNNKVILMYWDDIPPSFREECLRVACGKIFD